MKKGLMVVLAVLLVVGVIFKGATEDARTEQVVNVLVKVRSSDGFYIRTQANVGYLTDNEDPDFENQLYAELCAYVAKRSTNYTIEEVYFDYNKIFAIADEWAENYTKAEITTVTMWYILFDPGVEKILSASALNKLYVSPDDIRMQELVAWAKENGIDLLDWMVK